MSKYRGLKQFWPESQRRLAERGVPVTHTATLKEARVVAREDSERRGREGVRAVLKLIELGVFNESNL